jgi:transaldolase/glucose-6-phosphate isomerase
MAGEEVVDGEIREFSTADGDALATAASTWLGLIRTGDYVGIHAYLAPTPNAHKALERIRMSLRDRFRVATTTGWGPRFLHSTGQLHKGGPGSGVFLQLVDTTAPDLEVPETDFSFGRLIAAQAAGDYGALRRRNRRLLRVDVGDDPDAGVQEVAAALGV